MSDRRIALNYIHAAELFHVMSVNMLWIDVDGKRTPAVEVYVNGGRGPDLVVGRCGEEVLSRSGEAMS